MPRHHFRQQRLRPGDSISPQSVQALGLSARSEAYLLPLLPALSSRMACRAYVVSGVLPLARRAACLACLGASSDLEIDVAPTGQRHEPSLCGRCILLAGQRRRAPCLSAYRFISSETRWSSFGAEPKYHVLVVRGVRPAKL